MKEWFTLVSEHAIVVIDLLAPVVIVFAALEAFIKAIRAMISPLTGHERRCRDSRAAIRDRDRSSGVKPMMATRLMAGASLCVASGPPPGYARTNARANDEVLVVVQDTGVGLTHSRDGGPSGGSPVVDPCTKVRWPPRWGPAIIP